MYDGEKLNVYAILAPNSTGGSWLGYSVGKDKEDAMERAFDLLNLRRDDVNDDLWVREVEVHGFEVSALEQKIESE